MIVSLGASRKCMLLIQRFHSNWNLVGNKKGIQTLFIVDVDHDLLKTPRGVLGCLFNFSDDRFKSPLRSLCFIIRIVKS